MDHIASDSLKEFGEEMLARETELEEYIPRDTDLHPQIRALILRHAQIRWSNWLAAQWGKTSEVPFPDLAGLWTAMKSQEPWETTFPAGYTLSPKAAYRGSVSNRPTQGLAYPARWSKFGHLGRSNISGHRSNFCRVRETEQWGPRHQRRNWRRRE